MVEKTLIPEGTVCIHIHKDSITKYAYESLNTYTPADTFMTQITH